MLADLQKRPCLAVDERRRTSLARMTERPPDAIHSIADPVADLGTGLLTCAWVIVRSSAGV